jgi:antitoxin component YwqK of YwqJK toxin-antitoxin module
MKYLVIVFLGSLFLFSCNEEVEKKVEKKEDLVEIKNGLFTEYYPGKKAIKYQGKQDETAKRDGRWVYYSETGDELSVTTYSHGLKNGFTMVKYPNGVLHYVGEYINDTMVGVWRTYDEKGKLLSEKVYE